MTQDDRGDCVGKLREIATPVCVQARNDAIETGMGMKKAGALGTGLWGYCTWVWLLM